MRRGIILVIAVLVFAGIAGGLSYFQFIVKPAMIKGFITGGGQPVASVAAADAQSEKWVGKLFAIGSFRATRGVDVAPQVGGVVRAIRFESSQDVAKGAALVDIDDSTEQADLKSGLATSRNAELTFARQSQLLAGNNTSKASLDTATATRDQAAAAVERVRAVIAQKAVVAPFAGRLGIRRIDVGQYVSPGTALITLQQLDPIYADFQVPEQNLASLTPGQTVDVAVDAYAGTSFSGKIQFIDSRVNNDTRNVLIRAEIPNPDKKLLPGMFANVAVLANSPKDVVTLPRTGVTYSLFGDSVYVLTPAPPAAGSAQASTQSDQIYLTERRFVRTGEVRDGRVAITEGLKPGEKVVTEGQVKLQPGAKVRIDPKSDLPKLSPLPRQ